MRTRERAFISDIQPKAFSPSLKLAVLRFCARFSILTRSTVRPAAETVPKMPANLHRSRQFQRLCHCDIVLVRLRGLLRAITRNESLRKTNKIWPCNFEFFVPFQAKTFLSEYPCLNNTTSKNCFETHCKDSHCF